MPTIGGVLKIFIEKYGNLLKFVEEYLFQSQLFIKNAGFSL